MVSPNVLEAALAIRSARAVEDAYTGSRMALERTTEDNVQASRALRDEMVDLVGQMLEQQQAILSSQEQLIGQLVAMTTVLTERLSEPVVVNVPQQQVTLEQQPVTVNVPKSTVQVNPVINPVVKAPDVVVEAAERTLPKRITIKHSDNTTSTIEFTK